MPPLTTYNPRRPKARPRLRKRNMALPATIALLAVVTTVALATAYATRPETSPVTAKRPTRLASTKPDLKDPFPKHLAFSSETTPSAEETVAPVDPLAALRAKETTVVASAVPATLTPAVVRRPVVPTPGANVPPAVPPTVTPEPTTPPVVQPPVTRPPVIAWFPWMNGNGLKLGHWK